MLRPDFDRFGAWFTLGNINLHLINGDAQLFFFNIYNTLECNWSLIDKSGRPNVHPDDDLIVSHIALDIGTEEKMNQLMK